ncbi:hypothetical protein AGMMS50230_16690 [Spirochaetia bacterium]|nr:hypothetical protein AGMMS50230_16690 [Spirochaetia bacterium]
MNIIWVKDRQSPFESKVFSPNQSHYANKASEIHAYPTDTYHALSVPMIESQNNYFL